MLLCSILHTYKSDTIKNSLTRYWLLDDFPIRSSVNTLSSSVWQTWIRWGISKSGYFCSVSSHHAIHGITADLCSSICHLLAWDLQLDLGLLLACNLEGNPAQRSIAVLSLQGWWAWNLNDMSEREAGETFSHIQDAVYDLRGALC